jgi:hypothetical protein
MADLKWKSGLSVFEKNIKRFKLEPQAANTDVNMKGYRNRISLGVLQMFDHINVTISFDDVNVSIVVSSSDYS